MTVYMSPAQLDKPVKIWGGVTGPLGLVVNSVGEIIVAESGGDIVVFDKEGKRLRSIERSKHQVEELRSVAVDSEDNIYFIGYRNNKVGMSNRNCDKLQVREVQQVKGPGYLDIAVVGDEVMVTEWKNGVRSWCMIENSTMSDRSPVGTKPYYDTSMQTTMETCTSVVVTRTFKFSVRQVNFSSPSVVIAMVLRC